MTQKPALAAEPALVRGTEHPGLAGALATPFWTHDSGLAPLPASAAPLPERCDLAIVGGGFTGLWTAIEARRRHPDWRIVVIERDFCGWGASGRNGGFCAPSISHGPSVAKQRWPREAETLVRLGRDNLDQLQADLERLGIDAEFERCGKLTVAQFPWQREGLRAAARTCAAFGIETMALEGDALREKLVSPLFEAGLFEPNYAVLNPAKLVAGLRDTALSQGVEICEGLAVSAIRTGEAVVLETEAGALRCARVALATNVAKPLLRRLAGAVIPVYDYAIVTRPLSAEELASIGWLGRYGVADAGNRFHYARKTRDNRILWGGYDAIYHFGGARDEARTQRPASFDLLARQFVEAFPPLADVPFTHAWGGVIDTSARTTFFAGLAARGRIAYAMGFTGQGVSASRFAALTMLDHLDGQSTERTRLAMLSTRPVPFPPEPLRALSVALVQKLLAREDETGRRALLLRGLDRLGIGFDS